MSFAITLQQEVVWTPIHTYNSDTHTHTCTHTHTHMHTYTHTHTCMHIHTHTHTHTHTRTHTHAGCVAVLILMCFGKWSHPSLSSNVVYVAPVWLQLHQILRFFWLGTRLLKPHHLWHKPHYASKLATCIDGFHGAFYHGNWRALHHHAACWLVNIHITWPFALQLP